MAQNTTTTDADDLADDELVHDVLDSSENGIAFVLKCDDWAVSQLRVKMLKSDKWTPREGYRNDVSPEDSYLKVSYHIDHTR
jgi:hypothetical protein